MNLIEQQYRDSYWEMMIDLEAHTKPDVDILRKRAVEQAYIAFNKMHGTDYQPRWAI